MKRDRLRAYLWIGLVISLIFAGWTWFRPYDWSPDPKARGKVVSAQVRQDHSYYWLDVRVKVNGDEEHDLEKPVYLTSSSGNKLEPADTTLAGQPEKKITEMWLRFWLEESDFTGPLKLHLNDGSLTVRNGDGLPRLGSSGNEYFTTSNW